MRVHMHRQVAAEFYRQSIENDPTAAETVSHYAALLNTLGEADEAEKFYRLAIGRAPDCKPQTANRKLQTPCTLHSTIQTLNGKNKAHTVSPNPQSLSV